MTLYFIAIGVAVVVAIALGVCIGYAKWAPKIDVSPWRNPWRN